MSKHGVDCRKVPHLGSGWLHGEDDDQPYSVDGVRYCGRCHSEMGTAMRTTASDGNSLDTARAQIASLIAERDELRAFVQRVAGRSKNLDELPMEAHELLARKDTA